MDDCLDNCDYALRGFALWYDEIRKLDMDGGKKNKNKNKNNDIDNTDLLLDWKISSNMLRAFECVGCWYSGMIPILNRSSHQQLVQFYETTRSKNTDVGKKEFEQTEKKLKGACVAAEKKTDSDKQAVDDDDDNNYEKKMAADNIDIDNVPDSLNMQVSLGVYTQGIPDGSNSDATTIEFVRIRSTNGVVRFAEQDASVLTLVSDDSPTKDPSSNYGVVMSGFVSDLNDSFFITVDGRLNDKLVARINENAVTSNEIFDIIYDSESPGVFRLMGRVNDDTYKYVGSNDNGSLFANGDTDQDGLRM